MNEVKFQKIYQKYKPRLLNFILTKVERKADAEEILQETMLSAFDSLPLFRGNSSLYTFLCAIAKHEVADFYRKKKIKTFLFSRLPGLEKIATQALSPERACEEKELKEEVLRVLRSLSEGYSQILRLKYIHELTYKEIGQKLKKSAKAVESKLARARQAFAEAWQSEAWAKAGLSPSGS